MNDLRTPSTAAGSTGNKFSVLISHPTGNQNSRNCLQSLAERGMLAEFWTAIAWNPESLWNQVLPGSLRAQLLRRAFPEAPRERIRSVPSREAVRLGLRSSPFAGLLCSDERPWSVIGMYRHFDRSVARRLSSLPVDAVYAYEGGALLTFREARRLRIRTVYELPSGHWYWEREFLRQEADRSPDMISINRKVLDSDAHLREKDEEIALADTIIVPSDHVRRTLAGVFPDDRIKVVQYGAPPVRFRPVRYDNPRSPLQVLYVGSLDQRKGIGYLLKAVDMLGRDVELTLVGERIAANAIVDAACRHWRWLERIPHGDVLNVMMQSDVLVLPSLTEGFGLVVTEALACGLPLIVTPNVGASDLISDGHEGFVVPICSAEAIADRLHALDQDRELLAQMSHKAQAAAAGQTWEDYRRAWAETMKAAR